MAALGRPGLPIYRIAMFNHLLNCRWLHYNKEMFRSCLEAVQFYFRRNGRGLRRKLPELPGATLAVAPVVVNCQRQDISLAEASVPGILPGSW